MRQSPGRLAAGVAALTVTALLAGCGGSSRPAASAGQGRGSLRVGLSSSMTTLAPLPFGAGNYFLYSLLYDTPVTMTGTTPHPALVASWSMAPGDRSLTLHLRKGITYSDGTPFGSSALVWNINWEKKPATGSHSLALWQDVTATATGPGTVTLNFSQPMPEIFAMLAAAPVVKPGAPSSGVGTGPFAVSKFVPGTSLAVKRNPHYWQPGMPHLDTITLTNYPDPASAALALQSGTVQMLLAPPLSQVARLSSAGEKIADAGLHGIYAMEVNTASPKLSDSRVREALSLAFDRASFIRTSLFGRGQPEYSIWVPGSAAYQASANTGTFDLAKAKSLLEQAGVSHLTLTIDSPAVLPQNEFLPVYQQDLAKIGISLKINKVDTATWVKEAAGGTFPELMAQQFGFPDYDPAITLGNNALRPADNAEHFSSATYTAMVSQAAPETVPSQRLADYRAIGAFYQQQAFVIPLATFSLLFAYSPKVNSVRAGFGGSPVYGALSVSG